MGLFDSIVSTFDNAVSGLFGTSGSYLGGSSYSDIASPPVTYQYPVYQPEYPQMPMAQNVQLAPVAIAAGRALAARFPSLYSSLVALSQQFGRKFTPEMLWRMLKQQGPGMTVGLIGAAAMNELFVWKSTHKTRRMNPANTRALRRSMRRLKSFDRLARRVSSQIHRGGSRRSKSRCSSCKRSPCAC